MSISENSIKALKDYLNSGKVSEWLASSIISHYGYYYIDYSYNDFEDTCKDLGIDDQSIDYLIFCEGELEESVVHNLRDSKTYQFCIDHVMDLFNDYDEIMDLVKTENLQVWHDIKHA